MRLIAIDRVPNASFSRGGGPIDVTYRPVNTMVVTNNFSKWSLASTPTGAQWKAWGYGNGRFIMIGTLDKLFDDPDDLPAIFNNGQEYANVVVYSDDGINWYNSPQLFPGSTFFSNFSYTTPKIANNFIVHGNDRFLIAMTNGGIAVSSDGISWNRYTAPHPSSWGSANYATFMPGSGLFMYKPNDTYTYYTSPDGITWTTRSLGSYTGISTPLGQDPILAMRTAGNTTLIAIGLVSDSYTGPNFPNGSRLLLLRSSNLTSWTELPTVQKPANKTFMGVSGIAINDLETVAVVFCNGYYFRYDLTNNTYVFYDVNLGAGMCGYQDGKFYSANGSTVSTSVDGITWTTHLNALPSDFTHLLQGGIGYKLPVAGGTYDGRLRYNINATVSAIAVQADGKTIVGGSFNTFDGVSVQRIARLTESGSLDTAFLANTGSGANREIYAIAIQPDGKIILGGNLETFNGATVNSIVRLNSDGTRDTAFTTNAGSGFNSTVQTISLQADGKIIVGGFFTSFNGSSAPYVVRLNTDGTRDNTFSVGSGPNNWVYASTVQSDGKILLGGTFTSFNGFSIRKLVKLNSDGTRDTAPLASFTTSNQEYVTTLQNQPDGKILIGGRFLYSQPGIGSGIARIGLNGLLDTTFNSSGIEIFTDVFDIAVQQNGQILVAGTFLSFNGISSPGIARLSSNGVIDQGFSSNVGLGPINSSNSSGFLNTVAVHQNGKIFIGGNFESFNSNFSPNLACLGSASTT
jgi:uncharacterized delta-60 repeat protein